MQKLHPLGKVLIRNRRSVLGIQSRREAKTILVEMSLEERQLYDDLTAFIRDGYDTSQRERNAPLRLLDGVLPQDADSSSNALRKSFRRRADRLRSSIEQPATNDPAVWSETTDDPEELSNAVSIAEASASSQIEAEIDDALESLASRLDHIADGKARTLLEIVTRVDQEEPGAKVVIFTQFIETQEYLKYLLGAAQWLPVRHLQWPTYSN